MVVNNGGGDGNVDDGVYTRATLDTDTTPMLCDDGDAHADGDDGHEYAILGRRPTKSTMLSRLWH